MNSKRAIFPIVGTRLGKKKNLSGVIMIDFFAVLCNAMGNIFAWNASRIW